MTNFFNQIKENENRINKLEQNKDDIYQKITKQLKKDISIYEEFEL
jgi:tetrahydromethanopterin S-methyltransferase subunit G